MWRRPKCRVLAVKVAQTIPQWLYMARNDCQPHRARRGTIGKIGPNGIIGATRMPSSKMPIFAFHSQHVVQIRSGAKNSEKISLIHIYGFKHREIKPNTSKIWQTIKLVPEEFATGTREFPGIRYQYRQTRETGFINALHCCRERPISLESQISKPSDFAAR